MKTLDFYVKLKDGMKLDFVSDSLDEISDWYYVGTHIVKYKDEELNDEAYSKLYEMVDTNRELLDRERTMEDMYPILEFYEEGELAFNVDSLKDLFTEWLYDDKYTIKYQDGNFLTKEQIADIRRLKDEYIDNEFLKMFLYDEFVRYFFVY